MKLKKKSKKVMLADAQKKWLTEVDKSTRKGEEHLHQVLFDGDYVIVPIDAWLNKCVIPEYALKSKRKK